MSENNNQKKFVLIAEDDLAYAHVYEFKLKAEGLDVAIAQNGAEALELIKKRVPDLIILDLVMPIVDGFTALKEIRQNPTYRNVKILVASNLLQEEDMKKARDLGADDYIVKANISIAQLIEKVKEYLSK